MKKALVIFLSICLSVFTTWGQIIKQPNPPRLVVDEAGVLSDDKEATLEQKLVKYDDTTSTQILVVVIQSLNGLDVFDYAQQLGEEWGVGQKGKDNGIVILVSIGDRKMRIHPGRGVEDKITDGFSSDVVNNIMKPAFKKEQYYQGIDEAATAIMQQLNGTYKGVKKRGKPFPIIAILFFFILGIVILAAALGKGGGGGTGGGGGLGSALFWTALGSALSSRGSGGSGGGWGGGSSGGGGGFGGFGGGSFGGGGASGSW